MVNKPKALEALDIALHKGGDHRKNIYEWWYDFAGTIREALSSPQWEDIGTAPREYCKEILGSDAKGRVFMMRWDSDDLDEPLHWCHSAVTTPTHWMPLPLPPMPKGIEG